MDNYTKLKENIDGILKNTNKDLTDENSNKDATMASTQRDLIAGEYSKMEARLNILPKHLAEAHDEGIIHIHDMDYLVENITNCCLINLKDIFENGTVINKKKIDTPKSLRTACTLASQVVLSVSSSQFGKNVRRIKIA